MIHRLRKLIESEKGATAVEYGLILAVIVLAIIAALTNVATKTNSMRSNVSNAVNNV